MWVWVWVWVGVGLGWDDSQISNFQTELRYLGSLKFYHVPTDLEVPPMGMDGVGECRCGCGLVGQSPQT